MTTIPNTPVTNTRKVVSAIDSNRYKPNIGVLAGSWGFKYGIEDAGGFPWELEAKDVPEVLELIEEEEFDGFILTGGGDVNPKRYGERERKHNYGIDDARDEREFAIAEACIKHNVPIMGVCRGCQLLNVALGGSLVYDLPSLEHTDEHGSSVHRVDVLDASHLFKAVDDAWLLGQSYHHQAVEYLGDGLVISALAKDGTVEAIESVPDSGHTVLGIQFHPEMRRGMDKDNQNIFNYFVALAAEKAGETDFERRWGHRYSATVLTHPKVDKKRKSTGYTVPGAAGSRSTKAGSTASGSKTSALLALPAADSSATCSAEEPTDGETDGFWDKFGRYHLWAEAYLGKNGQAYTYDGAPAEAEEEEFTRESSLVHGITDRMSNTVAENFTGAYRSAIGKHPCQLEDCDGDCTDGYCWEIYR